MPSAQGAYATLAAIKLRLGITDTTDDALIETFVDQVNQFIEGPQGCGRIVAPIASATYLLDGNGRDRFFFKMGVRAISALAVGSMTGASRTSLSATDYFLRPSEHEREPGWPPMWVVLSDISPQRFLPIGFETISMTATAGWEQIPDDVTDVALTCAVRAWSARQSGQADIVGNDETGAPIVSRFLSSRDRDTLKKYRVLSPG